MMLQEKVKSYSSIRLNSFAKINLALEILGKRSDGYHELRTIFQTIDLHDVIYINETAKGIEIESKHPDMPLDENNLAYKAAKKIKSLSGVKKGLHIRIEKNIPIAAGLGGGSSNAASTLLGLNKLWNLKLDDKSLITIAAAIGSDVPFFILGGTALGLGRGDELFALKEITEKYIILACPRIHISSEDAYKKWNLKLTKKKNSNIILRKFVFYKGNLDQELRNDFEGVIEEAPLIAEIKAQMKKSGSRICSMSGSGPAVFGIFDDSGSATKAYFYFKDKGYNVFRSKTMSSEAYKKFLFRKD
jgi:4-diphosphocytidyl-2-C-methyl-D-erythritol kinase